MIQLAAFFGRYKDEEEKMGKEGAEEGGGRGRRAITLDSRQGNHRCSAAAGLGVTYALTLLLLQPLLSDLALPLQPSPITPNTYVLDVRYG